MKTGYNLLLSYRKPRIILVVRSWILRICEVRLHADILGSNPVHWLLKLLYRLVLFFFLWNARYVVLPSSCTHEFDC